MRIATWNVNSLKARQETVEWWLERAAPDVLLLQETKLTDADAPGHGLRDGRLPARPPRRGPLERRRHRGREGLAIDDVVTNFGDGPVRDSGPGRRRRGADGRGGLRPVRRGADGRRRPSTASASSASTRRTAASSARRSTQGKLAWFARLARWLRETPRPTDAARAGRRPQRRARPTIDVWDAAAVHGGTHVSEPERAAFRGLLDWGLIDAYRPATTSPGGSRGGTTAPGIFHKNLGMRIDHLLVSGAGRGAGRGRRDRPRGAQGQAGPVGPRAARHRPRRARPAVRPRLGRRPGTHRGPDQAAPLTVAVGTQDPGASPISGRSCGGGSSR